MALALDRRRLGPRLHLSYLHIVGRGLSALWASTFPECIPILLPVLLGLASAVPETIDDRRWCCCWLVLQSMVELMLMVMAHAHNRCL